MVCIKIQAVNKMVMRQNNVVAETFVGCSEPSEITILTSDVVSGIGILAILRMCLQQFFLFALIIFCR